MAKRKAQTEDQEVIKKLDHDLEEELEKTKAIEPAPTPKQEAQDSGLAKPVLTGTNKVKTDFEQPGTDNQSRKDIGLEPEL
jgi:hypothetical protein